MLVAQCHIDDWTALKALYESTDGDNWNINTGWEAVTSNTPPLNCNLDDLIGVIVRDGRVAFLELPYNQLNGNIPVELGNLSNLLWLVLSGNKLTDNIPAEIGNISSLDNLTLSNNQLSGSIPAELGKPSKLRLIHLNDNQLSGSIPVELCALPLTILALSNNNLSGCYPDCMSVYCNQFYDDWSNNRIISNGNNFNAPWEDFCDLGAGTCTNCELPAVGIFECAE